MISTKRQVVSDFSLGAIDLLTDASGASDFEHELADSGWQYKNGTYERRMVAPGGVAYEFMIYRTPQGFRVETRENSIWVLIGICRSRGDAEHLAANFLKGF